MTKFQIEGKLNGMMGKQYSYNLKEHTFLRFKCEEEFFTIVTDKQDLSIKSGQAKDFFSNCLIIDHSDAHVPSVPAVRVELPPTTLRSNSAVLSETILESIRLIKENKEYIPQANAINDQLKTMVEIGKAEIEAMKLQVQLHKVNGL